MLQATIQTLAGSFETAFACLCCRFVTDLPFGETISEDEDRMCFECDERARERVGVDYDASELGGDG